MYWQAASPPPTDSRHAAKGPAASPTRIHWEPAAHTAGPFVEPWPATLATTRPPAANAPTAQRARSSIFGARGGPPPPHPVTTGGGNVAPAAGRVPENVVTATALVPARLLSRPAPRSGSGTGVGGWLMAALGHPSSPFARSGAANIISTAAASPCLRGPAAQRTPSAQAPRGVGWASVPRRSGAGAAV
eukprot:scaffold2552_cov380-Prasinococcus_capsulatus_cf.AAC.36